MNFSFAILTGSTPRQKLKIHILPGTVPGTDACEAVSLFIFQGKTFQYREKKCLKTTTTTTTTTTIIIIIIIIILVLLLFRRNRHLRTDRLIHVHLFSDGVKDHPASSDAVCCQYVESLNHYWFVGRVFIYQLCKIFRYCI